MKNSSSGAVLLMVLVLVTIMYLITHTLLMLAAMDTQLSSFEQRSVQAFYVAESSITLGISRLQHNLKHRTDIHESMQVGANPASMKIEFYAGADEDAKHHRESLEPSRYHFVIRGIGSVPGLQSSARRMVEQHVYLKPFALFAEETILLQDECEIDGNVHGNEAVNIDSDSSVLGTATSHEEVVMGTLNEEGTEPVMALPDIPVGLYLPKYRYDGKVYEAGVLSRETIELPPGSPAPTLELYTGMPDSYNPAGIFYFKDFAPGSLNAIWVKGTVVAPLGLFIHGAVTIQPVEHFPAIIALGDVDITLLGSLEDHSVDQSFIEGFIYSQGSITMKSLNINRTVVRGSMWGQSISLDGVEVEYDYRIEQAPPPGLELVERAAWQELFERIPATDDEEP